MRKGLFAVCVVSLFMLWAAGTARAQNAHFVGTATVNGVASDGTISVTFKEAGLGNDVTISYSLTGSYVADYGCINRGGKHPQASNKTAESGVLNVTGSASSGKNGVIRDTLTFTPEDASSVLSCPGNQVAVLADIAYTGLSLEDTSNSIFAVLSTDSLSATFFTF
jgi:hypothetical protein